MVALPPTHILYLLINGSYKPHDTLRLLAPGRKLGKTERKFGHQYNRQQIDGIDRLVG